MELTLRSAVRKTIGDTIFFVDHELPVCVLRRPHEPDLCLSWPELDTGIHSPTMDLHPTDTALWVVYRSNDEGGDERYPALSSKNVISAVRIGIDGTLGIVRTEAEDFLGVTNLGLWTVVSAPVEVEESYRGGKLPAGWSHLSTLSLHAPNRTRRSFVTDRYAYLIYEVDTHHFLVVSPSPAVATPEGYDGFSFDYRTAVLPLGPLTVWPSSIVFRHIVRSGWGRKFTDEIHEFSDSDPEPTEEQRFDVPASVQTVWTPVQLSEAQKSQAISAMSSQFKNAATYWTTETGQSSPLSQDMSQIRMEIKGTWPLVTICVSFCHPYFAGGRMQRSIEVFDAAGRIRFNQYADIHLMEDLDTLNLPDKSAAHDGILEI